MRIGLVRMRFSPFGGAEVFLQRFISELKKRGHSIEVFSSDWPAEAGIIVHRVRLNCPSFLRPVVFARNAAKAIKEAAPDVVVSLDRTLSQDIYRGADGCHMEWLVKRRRFLSGFKKLALKLSPMHREILNLEKRLFSDPALKYVVAISERCKEEYIRHYNLPAEKICVIYCGIDPDIFSPERLAGLRPRTRQALGLDDNAVAVLFVGSGFERKGLRFLINAIASIKDRADIRLIVVGKGSQKGYIRQAEALGIADRVVFKGPQTDTLSYYAAADIFCLPSIYEPFSNACLEAMASGLPVVASEATGASEIIRHLESGAIVKDPADTEELGNALLLFLPAAKRKKAGALARQIAGRHTLADKVDQFMRLIEKVNNEKSNQH